MPQRILFGEFSSAFLRALCGQNFSVSARPVAILVRAAEVKWFQNHYSRGWVSSVADGPAIPGPGLPVGQTRPPRLKVLKPLRVTPIRIRHRHQIAKDRIGNNIPVGGKSGKWVEERACRSVAGAI